MIWFCRAPMSFLSSSLHCPSFPLVSFSCSQSQIHSSLWLHISQILFFGCALPTTLFSWCLLFISSQTRTCKSLAFFWYFLAKRKYLHITCNCSLCWFWYQLLQTQLIDRLIQGSNINRWFYKIKLTFKFK